MPPRPASRAAEISADRARDPSRVPWGPLLSTESNGPRIDAGQIHASLDRHAVPTPSAVREILGRARELKGLGDNDVAVLLACDDPDLDREIFAAASAVKTAIYGNRLVLFAPLYITNKCRNECRYCAFRGQQQGPSRAATSPGRRSRARPRIIIDEGHKRILLVAGESYPVRPGPGLRLRGHRDDLRREVAQRRDPPPERQRRRPRTSSTTGGLSACGIGTYQLFQETYHRPTYDASCTWRAQVTRPADWHIGAMDRAMQAGIDDVGIGVLFGLYDWRFELLAMMQHARHLEDRFGVGPHTISRAPHRTRLRQRPWPVNRRGPVRRPSISCASWSPSCAWPCPTPGIILSTRENANIRRECYALGVSQISPGSRTNPGGYAEEEHADTAGSQFSLGDHRPLDEVIRRLPGVQLGFPVPLFCTAGMLFRRTSMAAPGGGLHGPGASPRPDQGPTYCQPNAILTVKEYLEDYASPPETWRAVGGSPIRSTRGPPLSVAAIEPDRPDIVRRLRPPGEDRGPAVRATTPY